MDLARKVKLNVKVGLNFNIGCAELQIHILSHS